MVNFRKYGPPIKVIDKVVFPTFDKVILDNGIPLYIINQGTQDIVKLEVVFNAGRSFEKKKVTSRTTNSQIKEGSLNMNSKQISDTIDYYGATLRTTENLDSCSLHLFSLGKHFQKLLPTFHEIVTTPTFPKEDLRKYIGVNSERLKVELEKNDVIAYRAITEYVYGKDHPYGYNSEIEDYQALTRDDLVEHYQANYGSNNCFLFLSGKVNEGYIKEINKYFGSQFRTCNPKEIIPEAINYNPIQKHITSDKDLQIALKMGRKLFDRGHEDYPGMYFLNAVLGGYFGSRLMSNIREEKGFTYNIYSEVDAMKHDGMFMIGTEVGEEYFQDTMLEIKKELNILRSELIPEEELTMVRNYLLGRILNFIDGPFNSSRLLKSMIVSDLGTPYFDHLISKLKSITSEELYELANTYLREEDMTIISVGKDQNS